jgi:hypothetical protein
MLNFVRREEMYVEEHDIARILASQELSLEDVKIVMRGARYDRGYDERFDYANTLLSDAWHYLRPHTLGALVRAEIAEDDAALDLERNKAFFSRLADLLPSLVRFFGREARSRNPKGIISTIDDCHNDFHYTIASSRRDRQLREAKEKLADASKLASELASALENARRHFDIEFDRYRKSYYKEADFGPARFLGDLIHELQMCSGVLEIVNATADIQPKRLFVHGNDQRTTVVEWAYHMCTMWEGPKLVTTPGSDFAALCSLLFEAVSGRSDEGLAGAINRYARSEDRKQWDREGEDEDERDNDNFLSLKNTMNASAREVELCKVLLRGRGLSDMARVLLLTRIEDELRRYEVAQTTYGPRQVYLSQMNEDQWGNMLMEAVSRLKPEQIKNLDEKFSSGKSSAAVDIELGQQRRLDRMKN